jgi:alpha/beta superfamily hydrolase
VRSRELFAERGLMVAVIDKPSDRSDLTNFRLSAAHVSDVKAVLAWLRNRVKLPVWLVGTSRGTQSAAFVAGQLQGDAQAPDGLVLTSTMLRDDRDTPVTEMALDRLRLPVLVVHHEQDGCKHCPFWDIPKLMDKLVASQRKQLLSFSGGESVGNVCGPRAYHGYNGIERSVVDKIAAWILGH